MSRLLVIKFNLIAFLEQIRLQRKPFIVTMCTRHRTIVTKSQIEKIVTDVFLLPLRLVLWFRLNIIYALNSASGVV